jgi:recombination protein RecA
MKSALLRAQVEAALGPGFASPFTFREKCMPEVVSSGLEEIDVLTGGVPRGGLTEIVGLASSGRTALALAILAAMTAREEVCAWVDAQDTFDPCSAQLAGADLERLLWVRCRNIDQTLRTADLLIHSGGFGMVVLDLSDVAPRIVRRVPLSYWFRFRRAVEHTPTVLVLLEQEPCAKTCASLVLGIRNSQLEIGNAKLETGNWRLETGNAKLETRNTGIVPPHSLLFCGTRAEVAMIRSRLSQTRAVPSSIRTGFDFEFELSFRGAQRRGTCFL